MNRNYSYVLITPARNEEEFIESTLRSVVSQTVLPKKWVVVSDGSTDRTDEIVKSYCEKHPWIQFIRMPEERDRSFGAKVDCFNAGFAEVASLEFEVIGNLDADISFEGDYLEFLLERFEQMGDLGVAGTPFSQPGGYDSTVDSFEGENHVPGGCQLFRRQCFDEIGGYKPIKGGGIDWVAVTTARMLGWKTRSFKEKRFFHHRPLGTAETGRFGAAFHYGKKDYFLGAHPLWETLRALYRMTRKPYVVAGITLGAGYLWGICSRPNRPISRQLVKFHRREQMKKLRRIMGQLLRFRKVERFS